MARSKSLAETTLSMIGAVPLPVLEQRMAQFIADGGENPPPPADDRLLSAP